MSVNVKLARWRKAQRSTGHTTAQSGARSDGRFQRPSESSTTSLSLFIEAFGIEVEEEIFTIGYPDLGRRSMDRTMVHGTKRSMAESDS